MLSYLRIGARQCPVPPRVHGNGNAVDGPPLLDLWVWTVNGMRPFRAMLHYKKMNPARVSTWRVY